MRHDGKFESRYRDDGIRYGGASTNATKSSTLCEVKVSSSGTSSRYIGCRGTPAEEDQMKPVRRTIHLPRCAPKTSTCSKSNDHAQTVKNLSSCNSRACCPSADRMDVNDP